MTDEQKAESKKRRDEDGIKERSYRAQLEIKGLAVKAFESLRKIEGFAASYKLIFAVDHDKYSKMTGKDEPVAFDILQALIENRISSREEHANLEYTLRRLMGYFKDHERYADARMGLPSTFCMLLENHISHRSMDEISQGWTSRQLMERMIGKMLESLQNQAHAKFYAWLQTENEKTGGRVDIRNFPKMDPSDQIAKIIEFVEFPDIATHKISMALGQMTIMDFYGLKDAIRVMASVVEVHQNA